MTAMLKRHFWRWPAQPGQPNRGWKTIPFAPSYEAHASGLIRNKTTRRVLAGRKLPRGYLRVALVLDGHPDAYVHTAILEAFRGPRPSKQHEASHLDGDPANNALANLGWETRSANNRRKDAHGTAMTGEKNVQGRKTHCPHGHEYDAKNTRRSNGRRVCRTCAREWMRARRAKR